jgi:hypothetical protein
MVPIGCKQKKGRKGEREEVRKGGTEGQGKEGEAKMQRKKKMR